MKSHLFIDHIHVNKIKQKPLINSWQKFDHKLNKKHKLIDQISGALTSGETEIKSINQKIQNLCIGTNLKSNSSKEEESFKKLKPVSFFDDEVISNYNNSTQISPFKNTSKLLRRKSNNYKNFNDSSPLKS